MPLFSMEVRHQYLNGGAYSAFTMLPLGATEKVMRRFGWAGAQMENKFTLYADSARAAASLKQNAAAVLNAPDLCFAMQFRDPDFARYTDLPVQPGSSLFFAPEVKPRKVRQPHLSVGSMVSAADLIPVQSRSFQHPVPAKWAHEVFWLENLSRKKVLQLPAPVNGSVRVDISILDIGIYLVTCKNGGIYTFTNSNALFNLQSYSYFSIPLNNNLLFIQSIPVVSKTPKMEITPNAPHFHLTFPARSTIWRYDFFNHGAAAAADYAVVPASMADNASEGPTPPVFHRVPGMTGQAGETSLAFESIRSIPLSAQPGERFKLWRHKKTLIAELPTPELDFTRAGEGGALRSSHFIHL